MSRCIPAERPRSGRAAAPHGPKAVGPLGAVA